MKSCQGHMMSSMWSVDGILIMELTIQAIVYYTFSAFRIIMWDIVFKSIALHCLVCQLARDVMSYLFSIDWSLVKCTKDFILFNYQHIFALEGQCKCKSEKSSISALY